MFNRFRANASGSSSQFRQLHQYRRAALIASMGLWLFPGNAFAFATDACNNNIIGTSAAAPCATPGASGSSNVIGTSAGVGMTGINNNVIGTSAGAGLTGSGSDAIGYMAATAMTGSSTVVVGYKAGQGMTGSTSVAIGYLAGQGMTGSSSTAIGYLAGEGMTSLRSSAIGYMAGQGMTSVDSSATGYMAGQQMTGTGINVIGNMAGQGMTGDNSSAIGNMAGQGMTGSFSSAIGYLAAKGMTGSYSNVVGYGAGTLMTGSSNNVFGNGAGTQMTGASNSAIGNGAGASMTGSFNVAIGNAANTVNSVPAVLTSRAVAIGEGAIVSLSGSVALGSGSTAGAANTGQAGYLLNNVILKNNLSATSVVGVGRRQITDVADGAINATSTDAVTGSQLFATDQAVSSIVSGANAVVYTDANHKAVWLGGSGSTIAVALGNVASANLTTDSKDAVNGSQLFSTNANAAGLATYMANALGGNASYGNGTPVLPSYRIQGSVYSNVGAALAAIDFSLTAISSPNGPSPSGPAGPVGATGPVGPIGPAGANGTNGTNGVAGSSVNGVQYDQPEQTSVTLGGAAATTPVKLGNVAAGVAPMDAVNVEQMNTQTTAAVQTANNYTNTASRQTLASADSYTDQSIAGLKSQMNDQFSRVNTNISRACALGTAMTQMAMAGASAGEGGRIAAGVGLCSGGASAVSAGYATPLGDRTHFNFGAAVSAGMGSVGAGVGYDLN